MFFIFCTSRHSIKSSWEWWSKQKLYHYLPFYGTKGTDKINPHKHWKFFLILASKILLTFPLLLVVCFLQLHNNKISHNSLSFSVKAFKNLYVLRAIDKRCQIYLVHLMQSFTLFTKIPGKDIAQKNPYEEIESAWESRREREKLKILHFQCIESSFFFLGTFYRLRSWHVSVAVQCYIYVFNQQQRIFLCSLLGWESHPNIKDRNRKNRNGCAFFSQDLLPLMLSQHQEVMKLIKRVANDRSVGIYCLWFFYL